MTWPHKLRASHQRPYDELRRKARRSDIVPPSIRRVHDGQDGGAEREDHPRLCHHCGGSHPKGLDCIGPRAGFVVERIALRGLPGTRCDVVEDGRMRGLLLEALRAPARELPQPAIRVVLRVVLIEAVV
eukprot:scaffold12269_cov45-Phaeocystis_antarctica.AAC.2